MVAVISSAYRVQREKEWRNNFKHTYRCERKSLQ